LAATLRRHRAANCPLCAVPSAWCFKIIACWTTLSTFDNVALPLRVANIREQDVKRHVEELLAWVGLKDHMHARPPTLSGGQKQRVSIARAVISRPKLLMADEPTGNVDDRMGFRLMHLFEELNKLGTTIVVATHNEAMVQQLGHPVMRLDAGTLAITPGSRAQAIHQGGGA